MSTNFTPTIASLTRDLENADRALSDRLAHCQRLAAENAALIEALKLLTDAADHMTIVKNRHDFIPQDWQRLEINAEFARAIIARYTQE